MIYVSFKGICCDLRNILKIVSIIYIGLICTTDLLGGPCDKVGICLAPISEEMILQRG